MAGTRGTGDWGRFESIFGPEGEAGRRIRLAVLMLSGIIVAGTTGYVVLGWDFLDALYMTVITVGTIGFEEVNDLDEDPLGRLWTIVLIISSDLVPRVRDGQTPGEVGLAHLAGGVHDGVHGTQRRTGQKVRAEDGESRKADPIPAARTVAMVPRVSFRSS